MRIRSAKDLFRSCKIECKLSTIPGGGMGVFAKEDIKAGELLEVCQFITFGDATVDRKSIAKLFIDYRFWSDANKSSYSIVLGWGSVYNSSENRNATWVTPENNRDMLGYKIDGKNLVIRRLPTGFFEYWTVKDIKAGEEIFLNYHDSSFKPNSNK